MLGPFEFFQNSRSKDAYPLPRLNVGEIDVSSGFNIESGGRGV